VRNSTTKTKVQKLNQVQINQFKRNLKHEDADVREEAALYLAVCKDPQTIPLLVTHLGDSDPEVRGMICYALGEIGDTIAVGFLSQSLQDEDIQVRQVTAEVLGKIGSLEGIALLLECLQTETEGIVLEKIAQALGMINIEQYKDKKQVIEALEALAQEEDPFIQKQAFLALEKLNYPQPAPVTQESTSPLTNEAEARQESQMPSPSQPVKLLNWLEDKGSQLVDQVTETFNSLTQTHQNAYGWRNLDDTEQKRNYTIEKIKDLGIRLKGHSLVLLVSIKQENPQKIKIRLRLIPQGEQYLPQGLTLTILDENDNLVLDKSGTPLEAYARERDNWIQLELSGQPEEAFKAKIALGKSSLTEKFII
jgi:hypothetical protein